MTPETLIPATALRLIGAFYCFGSIIGARMVTRYSFIDHAIEAISGKKQPAAEKLRETIMIAGLLPVFAGGLALMLLSPFAPWLFALGVIWQAIYLGWFAPRYLDPHDDPGAEGRAKTWRAFALYTVCTALVLGGAFAGLLEGPSSVLAAALGAAATAAFGVWAFRALLNPMGKRSGPLAFGADADNDDSGLSESGFKIRDPDDISVIIRPSWNDGSLFRADMDQPVSWGWQEEHLSDFARDLLDNVSCVFRNLADPYDPRRCALINPEDVKTIEDEAKPALDILRQELGAGRVTFEPLPSPIYPVMAADRVKIEPFQLDAVIWSLDEPINEHPRKIFEDEFGISWSLARHLNEWAEDWRLAHAEDDVDGEAPKSAWTQAEHDAHEERGRILAVRLKRELAATGRGDVMVYYMTRSVGLLEAHADEDIPPLPPAIPDA